MPRSEFLFLNDLRRSGVVNMFGAGSYLEQAYDLSPRAARALLVEWMQWVNDNPANADLGE